MTSALMVRTKTRMPPERMPGAESGSVTRRKVAPQFAPSARAASSTSRGMFWMAPMRTSTMNGRKMCVRPMRRPAKLNSSFTGESINPRPDSAWFTSPFWASSATQPKVRTTRFSRSGKTTRMVSHARNRERERARKNASGYPITSVSTVTVKPSTSVRPMISR